MFVAVDWSNSLVYSTGQYQTCYINFDQNYGWAIVVIAVDIWLQACAFDIVSPQYTHNYACKDGEEENNLDKEL